MSVPAGRLVSTHSGTLQLGTVVVDGLTIGTINPPAGSPIAIGTGDNLTGYNPTIAQLVDVRGGTAGVPDTSPNPLFKLSRVVNLTTAQVGGAGVDEASGLLSVVSIPVTGQVQAIGVTGFAFSASTDAASADASGGYFVGQTTGTSQHVAIGLFGGSRIESTSASAKGSAIQLDVRNDSGFDHSIGAATFGASNGIWITTNGTNLAAAGIQLGNPFSQQFDVGLHFNSQLTGGLTGPTKTNDIRTDSNAVTSLLIGGTHTVAVAVNAGTAPVIVGGTALQATAGCLLEVQGPAVDVNPLVSFGSTANTKSYRLAVRNASGQINLFISGGTNNILTGTAAGDGGLAVPSGSKFFHLGGSISALKLGNDNSVTSVVDHTFAAHIVSTASGTPASSALGANVSSVTFTGNDVRGTIAVVMSGALAANTRISTNTFAVSYGATSPKVTLVDQTSAVGLTIVNFYVSAQSTGVSFDLSCDQALAAGTYTIDYICLG